MGSAQAHHTNSTTPAGWTGTSVARSPSRPGRHPLDLADWRAVERSAHALSALSNVSPALPTVGALGGLRADSPRAGHGSQGARRDRSVGVLHRRHFCGGEKRGNCVGKTKRGKGTKIMAVADRAGLPIAAHIASATPHEVTLVEPTLAASVVAARPERLIGDKAYDSDPLAERLADQRIELIAPHRANRQTPKTQDGRPLRRYKRRWKVERLFAWLQNFRRVLVRHEYHAENYLGFVHLGCLVILLRWYL